MLRLIAAMLLFTAAAQAAELADFPVDPIGPTDDPIGVQVKMAEIVAPPLTEEELQTLREALWKREIEEGQRDPTHIQEPTLFMQLAFSRLLAGYPLRRGDVMVLHGVLLSALQPNTFALAKHWQDVILRREPTS